MNRRALVLCLGVFAAACAKEEEPPPPPKPAPAEVTVGSATEGELSLESDSYAVLRLTGTATGADWSKQDAESLVVKVTVDGRVTRQLIWATGATEATHGVALGKLGAGAHTVKVEVESALSRAEAGATLSLKDAVLVPHADQTLARFAPILYGKDGSAYTDSPVLLYATRIPTGLRYSVVFTNEDGGTGLNPRLLVARWARFTDIEWALEVDLDASGNATAYRFQGTNHEARVFNGPKEEDHAVLRVDQSNNIFSDDGVLGLFRFAPEVVEFDETTQPREKVLDGHAWIYKLADQEGVREGKLDPACADPMKVWSSDCYLFVDGTVTKEPAADTRRLWGIQVLSPDGLVLSELDLGIQARQDRAGLVRIATPLVRGKTLTSVRLYADAGGTSEVFRIRLRDPRAVRIVDGAPTEVFTKPGVTVTVTDTAPQSTFGP